MIPELFSWVLCWGEKEQTTQSKQEKRGCPGL
jgi:hypothetical protein